MRITEARLKRLIEEEVEIYLLTEEMKGELLNQGIIKYLESLPMHQLKHRQSFATGLLCPDGDLVHK